MGDANENRNNSTSASSRSTSNKSRVMESLSLEINKYPRDLLQRFNVSSAAAAGGAHHPGEEEEEDDDDDDEEGIELNLGLSLGGRFGVEKSSYSNSAYSYFKKKKKLTRSSSIAGTIPLLREDDLLAFGVVNKTEMMAVENVRAAAAVAGYHQRPVLMRSSSLPAATEEEWRKRKEMQSLRRMEAKRRRSEKQQRGMLELERSSTGGETRSSANILSLQERINQEAVGSSVTRTNENLNKLNSAEMDNPSNRGREIVTNSVEDMPCVFTKGEGPNGRRVDGILYKYGKGEEVRIMCICHGMFHSPAEFVKHAGGGNVDHPLRHIVVNPSGPSL